MVQTLTDRDPASPFHPATRSAPVVIDYSLEERTIARRVSARSLASASRMAIPADYAPPESGAPGLAHLYSFTG